MKRTKIKEGQHTITYQEHPNYIGAKLVCIDDRFTLPSIIFKGKYCINKFIRWVLDKQKWIKQITEKYFNKRLVMANEDEEICNNSQICSICKEELNTDKVRDHCHKVRDYFSTQGLSWDAILKMTKIELEKINDPDEYMFFEQGIRGGVSYINKRYSKANNKYCPDYDKEKPEKYIIYLDMNNLYGCAMSQYLPYANSKWVKNIDKIKQKLMNIKINSLAGCILEVDLEYPQELHDIHNDYPLTPEKINIPKKWLSDYSLKIANAHNITIGKVKKTSTKFNEQK